MKALTPPRLLAATAAACFVLPSCQRNTEAKADSEWWRLEAERVEVAHQVELFELRLSKQKTGDQGFAALQAEVEAGDTMRRELMLQRDGLRQDIERTTEAVEVAKSDWMRATRAAATGREFAKFTGARGRTYENAVITRVTDVGVEFRHATGTARLAAADLTPAQHELFGLDAEIAGEAIRQERETAIAYGSWVDEKVAAAEAVQKEEDERIASAEASEASRATPSVSVSPEETSSRSRLHEPPRSFGRSSGTTWYSGSYYRPYSRSYTGYYQPYAVPRYRPSPSVLYDPSTGGAPSRVNVPPPYRAPNKTWVQPRSSGTYTPMNSGSTSSVTTP
jgi:hypothetical protein